MIFSIDRNNLLRALQRMSYAVITYKEGNRQSPMFSIWRSFIFDIDCDELTIKTSNSEVFMSETVSVGNPTAEKTMFAVDACQLLKAVKTLDGQSLEIEDLEYQIIVRHTLGSFALPLAGPVTEYKAMRLLNVNYNTAHQLNIEAPGLLSILNRCAYAIARDELRPAMNGVCVNLTANYTDFVASDGYKLVQIRKPSITTDRPAIMIIPQRVVSILQKITPKTGFVEIYFNEYVIDWPKDSKEQRPDYVCRIIVDGVAIVFKPIPARYPNYGSVIPKNFSREFRINRQTLIKSLERLSLFAGTSGLITYDLEKGVLKLSAENKDFETKGVEALPCEYDREHFRIGFKDYPMLQTLKNLCSTVVTFKVNERAATIIAPTIQPESEDVTMLLMPTLIQD